MNNWCQRKNLTPAAQLGRKRKLDWEALAQHIQENPDALLRERAQHFRVHRSAIGYAQTQMKLTRKKTLKYSERKYAQRIAFLRNLREIVTQQGSSNLVYLDESGFKEDVYRPYGWSKRGQKTYGDHQGKRGVRTSLIAGKRGKQLLAPVLFKGSTNALWFNQWLDEHLIPELKPNSTLILDNAAFHRQNHVFTIAEKAGHKVLFLPPYSPDFNRIEKTSPLSKKDVFIPLLVLPWMTSLNHTEII